MCNNSLEHSVYAMAYYLDDLVDGHDSISDYMVLRKFKTTEALMSMMKVMDCLKSCTNIEQVKTCGRMIKNFKKVYPRYRQLYDIMYILYLVKHKKLSR